MRLTISPTLETQLDTFRHEAFFYAGMDEFLEGTVPFVRDGVEAGDPVLVVVDAPKIEATRDALNGYGDGVHFADMLEVGSNPGRIISALREFVENHSEPGRTLRGIGEPIWPERSATELAECHRLESLLNVAFGDTHDLILRCPYDTARLAPAVVETACRTHPVLVDRGREIESHAYGGTALAREQLAEPLPEPTVEPVEVVFDATHLKELRRLVLRNALQAGVDVMRVEDLLLAVNELATNSVRYGGGSGTLRIWREDGILTCEVRDSGHIDELLVGREPPTSDQEGGFGLWLVNQLCDLMQVRSLPEGAVVRLHMQLV